MLRSPLRAYRVSGRTGAQLAPLPGYRSTRDLAIPGAHNHRGGLKETAARGLARAGDRGRTGDVQLGNPFGSASKTRAVLGIARLSSVPRAPGCPLVPRRTCHWNRAVSRL